jgi:hypothetical protein
MSFLRFGAVVVLGALPLAAHASGQRGVTLTPERVAALSAAPADALMRSGAVYVGTLGGKHLFIRVTTVVSGGMPFDHTELFGVAESDIVLEGGWSARVEGQYVEASQCPAVRLVAPAAEAPAEVAPATASPGPHVARWSVDAHGLSRETCGT